MRHTQPKKELKEIGQRELVKPCDLLGACRILSIIDSWGAAGNWHPFFTKLQK